MPLISHLKKFWNRQSREWNTSFKLFSWGKYSQDVVPPTSELPECLEPTNRRLKDLGQVLTVPCTHPGNGLFPLPGRLFWQVPPLPRHSSVPHLALPPRWLPDAFPSAASSVPTPSLALLPFSFQDLKSTCNFIMCIDVHFIIHF